MDKLKSIKGQKNLPRYFDVVFDIVQKLQAGTLDFELADGRIFQAEGSVSGLHAVIQIKNDDLFARLLREGDTGFAEAYMEGWWSTPDLQAFLDLVHENRDQIMLSFPGSGFFKFLENIRHFLNANSKRGSRRNIKYHYDLGNDFYAKWLDASMTYSSAYFKTGRENLEQAQEQKYASICDQMGVKNGDRLLEIGCGWGGFAEYAAKNRGAQMTCLTISPAQYEYANRRIENAGLSGQVEVVMRDYRDERGVYDGIASIEMFEAVGEKFWPIYFDKLNACLKPGGRATLQVITVRDDIFPSYRKTMDFIQKHIFPGGMLPSPAVLKEEILRAGLDFQKSVEFGKSYSLTLRRWFENFNESWDIISKQGFDRRFKRMWDYYLTSCASGFEYGILDVSQLTLSKPKGS